jgi:hypothetical protein
VTTLDERRRIYRIAMCWVLVCLPLIAGAPPAAAGTEKPDDIVAQVNGAAITRRMADIYRAEVSGALWSRGVSPPEPAGGLVTSMADPSLLARETVPAVVDAALLAQEAVRRGLDRQPYVAAQLRYAERYVASTLILSGMGRGSRVEAVTPTMPEMVVGFIDGEPVSAYDIYEEDTHKPVYEFDDHPDALEINLWAWPLKPQSEDVIALSWKIATVQAARSLNLLDKPAIQDELAAWRIGVLARVMRSALNSEAIASGRLPGSADTEILAFDFATDSADHALQLVAALRKGERAESLGLPLMPCPHGPLADYCRGDGRVVFDVTGPTLQVYPRFLSAIRSLPPGSVTDPIPVEPGLQSGAKTEDFTPAPPGIRYAFNVAVVVDRRERRLAMPATAASLASADAITAELLSQLRAKATIKITDGGH